MDNQNLWQHPVYIPSTVEKKKAIACLLFMGMVMELVSTQERSSYESYYLALSVGWRSIGFVMVVLVLLSLMIPFFMVVSLPFFIIWLWFGVIAIQQAWNGIYNHTHSFFRITVGVGSWLLSLFEIKSS